MAGTNDCPESPTDEVPEDTVLRSTAYVAWALGLSPASLSQASAAFFEQNPAHPTNAEATLVALALEFGAKRDQREWFVTTVLREQLAHGDGNGDSWSPP